MAASTATGGLRSLSRATGFVCPDVPVDCSVLILLLTCEAGDFSNLGRPPGRTDEATDGDIFGETSLKMTRLVVPWARCICGTVCWSYNGNKDWRTITRVNRSGEMSSRSETLHFASSQDRTRSDIYFLDLSNSAGSSAEHTRAATDGIEHTFFRQPYDEAKNLAKHRMIRNHSTHGTCEFLHF